MAIQVRRGDYNNFDPSKQVSGELAVMLSNDPNSEDGKAIYVSYGPGNAKRLATYMEIAALAELAQTAADGAEASEINASESAETASKSAMSAATSAGIAQEYKEYVEEAVNALPPILSIDFSTGELLADGGLLLLSINPETGNLEYLMAGGN